VLNHEMSSSFEFSHIFQVYTLNLIENLGSIERIRESMCTCEVLLENAKIAGRRSPAARC
jgi:hypothetical protein